MMAYRTGQGAGREAEHQDVEQHDREEAQLRPTRDRAFPVGLASHGVSDRSAIQPRWGRVLRIRRLIEDGTYSISSRDIAESMVRFGLKQALQP